MQEERQRLWTLGGVSCLQFFRPEIKGRWSQRRETSKQVAFWLTSKPLLRLEPGGSHQGNLLKSIWPSQTVSLCVEMKDLNRSVNQRIWFGSEWDLERRVSSCFILCFKHPSYSTLGHCSVGKPWFTKKELKSRNLNF